MSLLNVLDDEGLVPDVPAAIGAETCDACGVRAYVFTMVGTTEMAWCGHHWREFEPKLRTVAGTIIDLRYALPGAKT